MCLKRVEKKKLLGRDSHMRCSIRKLLLKTSQYSQDEQKNTNVGVSFQFKIFRNF